ncbi:MAG: hypothetical protein U0Z17_06470 [Bacteroidales bacterium]
MAQQIYASCIAASPWMNGEGDLVKMVSESCHKYNLKFGVYLSPWDRHEPSYGNSAVYNPILFKPVN